MSETSPNWSFLTPRLEPKTAEDFEKARTIEGIKELLLQHSRNGGLAYSCRRQIEAERHCTHSVRGIDEDFFALLAYHAVIAMERAEAQLIEMYEYGIPNIYLEKSK